MKKILCALVLVITCVSVVGFAETVETGLVVNESQIIKPSTKNMLGINDFWETNALYTGGNYSTDLSDNFRHTMFSTNAPLSMRRMAGADSQRFYWKDSLGELAERGNGSNLGLVEWIKFNKEMNPDIELTFTLNLNDSIENHKDLVRFLMLEPSDANAVDDYGFNWAQYRVDLGIEKPIEIKTFEIGNEVYYTYVDGCNDVITVDNETVAVGVENYIEDCKAIITAMKSVKEDINFSASTFSYTKRTSENTKVWNTRLIWELYKDCSYFVHHEYFFDYNFFWITLQIKERLLDIIEQLPVPDEEKPKVYISEYGYWMAHELSNLKDGTNLYGTLADAKFLNFMMDMPYIEMANIHVTSEDISTDDDWQGGWDLFRFYSDGQIYVTVPAEMLKIFGNAVGNGEENENIVNASLSGDNEYWGDYEYYITLAEEPSKKDILNVSAHTAADGGLNLLFVNSSENIEHNITAELENKYRLYEKEILTSENVSDNNLPGSKDEVYLKRYLLDEKEEFSECTIPAKSIVLLKLLPIGFERTNNQVEFKGSYTETQDGVSVGREFGIQVDLYENEQMANQSECDIYILKNNISPTDFVANYSENISNIVFVGSAEIIRNMLYFDVSMPKDAGSGEYYALIGKPIDGCYKTVDFDYVPQMENEYHISSLEVSNAVENVVNDEFYAVDIKYSSDFEGVPIVLKVVKATDEVQNDLDIVYIDEVIAAKNGKEKIYMPKDCLSGEYSIKILHSGEELTVLASCNFIFEKPDEFFSIYTSPCDENGNGLSFENICEAEKLKVTVKNKIDEKIIVNGIVAIYDEQGAIVDCFVSDDLEVAALEDEEVEISISPLESLTAQSCIKVFVWRKGEMAPLTNSIYIK